MTSLIKKLGLALGLHYPTLTSIESYRHYKVDECWMDMLSAWIEQQDMVSVRRESHHGQV